MISISARKDLLRFLTKIHLCIQKAEINMKGMKMSTKKRTKKDFSFGSFGGIDHTKDHSGKTSAESIVNFRLLSDGSLVRREGIRHFITLSGNIRAVCTGIFNGAYKLLALVGNTVSAISVQSGTITTMGTVGTNKGTACFFFLKEDLYLADGYYIYRYNGSEFAVTTGYVPTIGRNWPCSKIGEINEPRNILNRYGRITYLVDEPYSRYLCASDPIDSVEAVYVNGVLREEDEYSIDFQFNSVVIPTLNVGDTVEIRYKFKDSYSTLRKHLASSSSYALFGDTTGIRLFFCGGSGTGKVFQSRQVSEGQLYEASQIYPNCDALYFPAGSEFDVCNGTNAANALVRYRDKLLVFTDSDVWMVSSDGNDGALATGVNSRIGCPVVRGATASHNDPFSIGRDAVWHWSDTSFSDKSCKATNLSAPICGDLDEAKLKNCGIFYNSSTNEVWVYSKQEDIVWVYGLDSNAWYTFTGFHATDFFDLNGKLAFYQGKKIYVFDNELEFDIDESGNELPIIASYSSGIEDPMDGRTRTLRSISLRADLNGGPITLEFIPDFGEIQTYVLRDEKENGHSLISKRVTSGRFKYGRFKITASPVKQLIHSLKINAR